MCNLSLIATKHTWNGTWLQFLLAEVIFNQFHLTVSVQQLLQQQQTDIIS